MKKLLSLLLLSFVLILAACSSNEPEMKEEPEKETPVVEEEEQDEVGKDDPVVEEDSEDETKPEPEIAEEENSEPEPNTYITVGEVKEIIEYAGMGEDDKLVDAAVEGEEIKAVIELAPHDLLPAKNLAATSYSQASDALLERDDWQVLTIDYVNVGIISMNRLEKESNEYGDYFPTAKIEEIIGVEY